MAPVPPLAIGTVGSLSADSVPEVMALAAWLWLDAALPSSAACRPLTLATECVWLAAAAPISEAVGLLADV